MIIVFCKNFCKGRICPLKTTPKLTSVPLIAQKQRAGPAVLSYVVAGSLISLANGQMKKVEELQTEDFISSAKTNRDVFLDHSTLIKIENQEKSPKVTLTFSVGKDNIEVRI